jgi:hypothetical protein
VTSDFCQPSLAPGRPTLVMPVRTGTLPVDESCAARRAGLLAVIIGEADAFLGDAINIRCLVAHHATAVVADVPNVDIQMTRTLSFLFSAENTGGECRRGEGRGSQQAVKVFTGCFHWVWAVVWELSFG